MSMRKAINDKCKDCIYDPLDKGNWRQQVSKCTFQECSLYQYRPTSKSGQFALFSGPVVVTH